MPISYPFSPNHIPLKHRERLSESHHLQYIHIQPIYIFTNSYLIVHKGMVVTETVSYSTFDLKGALETRATYNQTQQGTHT